MLDAPGVRRHHKGRPVSGRGREAQPPAGRSGLGPQRREDHRVTSCRSACAGRAYTGDGGAVASRRRTAATPYACGENDAQRGPRSTRQLRLRARRPRSMKMEGHHECATVGYSFIGNIGGSGNNTRLGANGVACCWGGTRSFAKRCIRSGFLGRMGSSVLSRH